jgi:hypothetical protein
MPQHPSPAQQAAQHAVTTRWEFVRSAELRPRSEGLVLCLWVGDPVPWACWSELPAIARCVAAHAAIVGVQINELGIVDAEMLAAVYCAETNAPD